MVTDSLHVEPGSAEDLEQAAAVFTSVRPRLFGIAYRMLSSVTEAEDLVQEVWLRWQTCDRSSVVNPGAFLATTMTRLAINELQSARVRRETYVGPWLPEPVDTSADPYLGAERGEALKMASGRREFRGTDLLLRPARPRRAYRRVRMSCPDPELPACMTSGRDRR